MNLKLRRVEKGYEMVVEIPVENMENGTQDDGSGKIFVYKSFRGNSEA